MTRYVEVCPIGCRSQLVPTAIVMPQGPLLECSECGQLVSQVSAERYWDMMRAFDDPGYSQLAGRESGRRAQVANRRLAKISRLLGRPAQETRLVDVGCSRGHFLAAAVAAGYQAEGVEPAPRIVAAARAAGLRVSEGRLDQVRFPDASFDALTMFEVIEHVDDAVALARECRRILKPRGILCLSTGNAHSWTVAAMGARWDYFQMEQDAGHISFFNPRSIRMLAARTGFEVEAIATSRVKFAERTELSGLAYRGLKVLAELLNAPARLAGRGHDMLAYLRSGG
jgi:2-polyprenyl-3-methyl-5-hydroxy-6-metoxy-1,4-benzoquinol methylase